MKRALIQNVKAIPYTNGAVIDRAGFLSAVVAVSAAAAGNLKLAVTHSDTSTGTFEAVPDTRLVVDGPAEVSGLAVGDVANFDLDLVGCKQFIKVTMSGAAATVATNATLACAVVLGDHAQAPV